MKAIGNYAFYQCDLTGSLTIPNSVVSIGNYAFSGCEFTGSITIPNSVVTIGNHAFYDLYKISGTLTLGNSLTSIGDYAFGSCFSPGPSHTSFTGSLTIPNSVSSIGNRAFDHSFINGPGTLTIGNSVASMGYSVFANCTGFTQVIYNATNCANLASTDMPFEGCSGTLTIGSNVQKVPALLTTEANFTQVNYNAINCADVTMTAKPFEGCAGTLTIGNNVTRIPAYIFYNCDGFTGSVTIPNSVTTIGTRAFGWSGGFSGPLTIGTGVTSIESEAFYASSFTQVYYNAINCADVSNDDAPFSGVSGQLTIGSNVQRIPAYMFHHANFTGSLTIPNSVTEIGLAAFWYCTGFNGTLTIGNSVTTIGGWAFCLCSGFTGSLTIPNSVATIGDCAFSSCIGFTGSLSIGNSVTAIGNQAFENGNFSSVTLGNSVSSIGGFAFYNCDNFSSMTVCPETPPTMITTAFNGVSKSIPVYVPCNSVDAYQSASGWSEFTYYQCKPLVTVTAVPTAGGTVWGGGSYPNGTSVTVSASPNSGYLFMHWSKDGTVVSCNPSYTFIATEDADLEAVFVPQSDLGDIIGESTGTSIHLPSFSYYKYCLSQQIYTATELEDITTINSISFFNEGDTETRLFHIYMKHTPKTAFSNNMDWISVDMSNRVYTGSVVMRTGIWTTIMLDEPFVYDGNSNLALIVDDNTNRFTQIPHMACRVYNTSSDQALRIYSDDNDYDPFNPSYYQGTLMTQKNQIMLNRQGYYVTAVSDNEFAGTVSGQGQYGKRDLCTLKATPKPGYTFVNWTDDETGIVVSTDANYSFVVTENRSLTAHFMSGTDVCNLIFDLHDSYGDGWNGNQLVVNYENGMSIKLTLPSGKSDATYTLPIIDGSHVELSWIKGDYAYGCSFAISYVDGKVMYTATVLNENYEYEFDMNCSEQTSDLVYVGDHSKANNYYLPSYSFYKYSLSEQIYTANEIGASGVINSIAFYNNGSQTKKRKYNIYMTTTDKMSFASQTDWISTSDAVLVYSDSVTMHSGRWTPILFRTPFDYDGVSNLVLIVDDNTGSYTNSPHMSCLVYPTSNLQSIRAYNDEYDYYPSNPSSYTGTLQNVKNQILINIKPCVEPTNLNVTDITDTSASISWDTGNGNIELQFREWSLCSDFDDSSMQGWTTIDADDDGYNWKLNSEWNTSILGHNGSADFVMSESYSWSGGFLYPDNYLVSPMIPLGGSITFYASTQDEEWPSEHFGVAISTTGNTNAADFTTIQEWTMTASSKAAKAGHLRDIGNRGGQGAWYEYTVDLSAYSGQGYVAIRHFDCNNMWHLNVDDITIVQPGYGVEEWESEYYVTSPYTFTGLEPDTQYEVRVRSYCGGNCYSDWAYTTFTTGSSTVTQTVSLAAGWNWFSSYVEADDLLEQLEESLGENGLVIASSLFTTEYDDGEWFGDLDSEGMTNSETYMILTDGEATIQLLGTPATPSSHPITINPGWNWIGFPCAEEVDVVDALADFEAEEEDALATPDGIIEFDGEEWFGDFDTMIPGKGYMYFSNSTVTKTLYIQTTRKLKPRP